MGKDGEHISLECPRAAHCTGQTLLGDVSKQPTAGDCCEQESQHQPAHHQQLQTVFGVVLEVHRPTAPTGPHLPPLGKLHLIPQYLTTSQLG